MKKQQEQILPEVEMWLWCVADAVKNDDWDWVDSMPDAFYMALGIERPEPPDDLKEYFFAEGCWRTEPHIYD